MIRFAKPDDCAAMLAIYAPYIETTITFEQEVPSREAFSLRIADVKREYPWIVWEENGKILGYAYAHKFAVRISYRPSAELSVYLSPDARGKGIGRKLYEALFALLQLQNVKSVYGSSQRRIPEARPCTLRSAFRGSRRSITSATSRAGAMCRGSASRLGNIRSRLIRSFRSEA